MHSPFNYLIPKSYEFEKPKGNLEYDGSNLESESTVHEKVV